MKQPNYEVILQLLFKIPDPITIKEFCHRTGKAESTVRNLMDRRRLPIHTERELHGEKFSDMRLVIMWNEWLEMIYEVTGKLPASDRLGWKVTWFQRAKRLADEMGLAPLELEPTETALKRIFTREQESSESRTNGTAVG